MGDSLSSWLAAREAADATARSERATWTIVEALASQNPVRVLDLGTGTGSNVRYLATRLRTDQQWLCVDRDLELLAEVPARMSSWRALGTCEVTTARRVCVLRGSGVRCQIETERMDLGASCDPRIFSGRHLVTASALLDLVSETWMQALAARCRQSGAAAVLFALTYNGRSHCSPEEQEDDAIRDLVNRHQKTNDRGFGPAAGPDAGACAARCLAAAGYHVQREASDWVLSPDQGTLQRLLLEGWAAAALDIAPDRAAMIRSWLRRRLAHVEAKGSSIVVCHEDLAAWLTPDITRTK
jgi:hypothetical protein